MEFKRTQERLKAERRSRGATAVPTSAQAQSSASSPGVAVTVPSAPAWSGSLSPVSAAERAAATGIPVSVFDPLAEFLASHDDGSVEQGSTPLAGTDDAQRFLTFDLAGEEYAASIMDVREILKLPALTEVPRAPKQILGVLSKRGIVMPVVDLAMVLNLAGGANRRGLENRVLVVGDGADTIGLKVDRVRDVVRLSARDIEPVPATLSQRHGNFLVGLGRSELAEDRLLILLDLPTAVDALKSLVTPGNGDRAGAA